MSPAKTKSWEQKAVGTNWQFEERHIRHLHEVYEAGKLRILIGAGTSVDVGLPSWEALSLNLLTSWIDSTDEAS